MGSALLCVSVELNGSSAADEVHDDGDQRNDKQQVDQKAANVQEKKSAEPEQNQHHSQD
jgi:hypothetical protein